MKDEKQESLFGGQDKVYNVLQTEKTIVRAEIKRHQDAIDRNKKKIDILIKREDEIDDAIQAYEDQVFEKKLDAKDPFRDFPKATMEYTDKDVPTIQAEPTKEVDEPEAEEEDPGIPEEESI